MRKHSWAVHLSNRRSQHQEERRRRYRLRCHSEMSQTCENRSRVPGQEVDRLREKRTTTIIAKQPRSRSLHSKLLASLLKFGRLFLIFNVPPSAVRAPLGGPAETGAGGVRCLLVPILLNGGFGYEDYVRLFSPLAVDRRI